MAFGNMNHMVGGNLDMYMGQGGFMMGGGYDMDMMGCGMDSMGYGPPMKRPKSDFNEGKAPSAVLNQMYTGLEYNITETKIGSLPFFIAKVKVEGKEFEGCGKNKKFSKNDAAQKVLEYLEKVENEKKSNKGNSKSILKQTKSTSDSTPSQEALSSVKVDENLCDDVNAMVTLAQQSNYSPLMMLSKLRSGIDFKLVKEDGQAAEKLFTFSVTVDNRIFQGTASSKRTAKIAATKLALEKVFGVTITTEAHKRLAPATPKSPSESFTSANNSVNYSHGMNRNRGGGSGGGGGNGGHWNRRFDPIMQKLREMEGSTYELPPSNINPNRKFSNSCRLWVGNLPKATNEGAIKKMFDEFGESENIYYDENKNFAFITLDYKSNADKARIALNNKKMTNSFLTVKFSAPGSALKLRNLSHMVTNELLEYAFSIFGELEKALVICDDKGKPTGEGMVEFCKKPSAHNALKRCNQGLFFITFSPRPVIVEPLSVLYEGEGIKECDLRKNSPEYNRERLLGPRFAAPGSFEETYGHKWRQVYELFDMKKNMLEKELMLEEQQLMEDIVLSQYEYETNLLKDEVRQREEAMALNKTPRGGGMRGRGGRNW